MGFKSYHIINSLTENWIEWNKWILMWLLKSVASEIEAKLNDQI